MKTLIINLRKRKDRREEILEEVKKLDFLDYEIVDAVENRIGKVGCTLSHQLCCQIAKDWKLPYVLILEDDAYFTDNAREVFLKSWKAVQKYDWKLFYLGAHLDDTSYQVVDGLLEAKRPLTTHAYIVHESFYDTIIQGGTSLIIDRQLAALSYENKMYMCDPMISLQRGSYSNIVNKYTSYAGLMQDAYNLHVKPL